MTKLNHLPLHPVKAAVDAGAAGAIVATLVGWLPAIAAALAIVWYLVQIAESKTGQRFIAWVMGKCRRDQSTTR